MSTRLTYMSTDLIKRVAEYFQQQTPESLLKWEQLSEPTKALWVQKYIEREDDTQVPT